MGSSVAKYGRLALLATGEQATASVASLLFTLVLATQVSENEFGLFGIAWSLVMLVESVFWAVLGQPTPAVAARLPTSRAPEVYGALYRISLRWSVFSLAVCFLAAAPLTLIDRSLASTIASAGLAAFALRIQQVFKRIFYQHEMRGYALASAIIFALALAISTTAVLSLGWRTAWGALLAWTFALACAALVGLSVPELRTPPSQRVERYFQARSLRVGSPLILSSLLYWASTSSMLLLGGILISLEASGSLRLLQLLLMPLQQGLTVATTILTPPLARQLIKNPAEETRFILYAVGGFTTAASIYALLLGTLGTLVVQSFLTEKYHLITAPAVGLMCIAAILEAARTGAAAIFLARGDTKPILRGWIIASAVLVVGLSLARPISDFLTLPAILLASTAGATLIVLFEASRRLRV
ncbi:MAG: oligosaccharide flippase family protein [Devosia sp.]